MIYNKEYKIKYYCDENGESDVVYFIKSLDDKMRAKILKYIEYLRLEAGYLNEPLSKHISGKIRELRVDFWNHRHRFFYFCAIEKNIIILSGFIKKTSKTPQKEIEKAEYRLNDCLNNIEKYLYD